MLRYNQRSKPFVWSNIHSQAEGGEKCNGRGCRDMVIKRQLNGTGYKVRGMLHREGAESSVALLLVENNAADNKYY